MKEYLFRGKPVERFNGYDNHPYYKEFFKDGFVLGSLIVAKDKRFICVSGMASHMTGVNNGITSMIEVVPETVGQFIDKQDDAGVKIFEGDIIKKTVDSYRETLLVADIYSRFPAFETECYIQTNFMNKAWCNYRVVGNIHDNPELLKKVRKD